jgi:hypothetical protein
MALFSGIASFFDKYLLSYALGTAAGPSLEPFVQDLANEAWLLNQKYPVEPRDAALIVAEDVKLADWGANEAAQHGVNRERFDALVGETLAAPGVSQLFEAWRRNLIDDAAFQHGLRKAKLETRWDAPLMALKERLLSLDQLANARQQGFIDDARQHSESALQGLDAERADIAFELSGLPLGVETMQGAANRGLADRATFDQAIREGHTKTKYTDLAWALRQPILHATDYRTLHLKGWITEAEMNAGGALSGYTPAQMHLLYLEAGRPAAPGQMWTAAARGIDGPAGHPVDEAQFVKAIAESDIRPEYGPMLWGIRYLYPPLFQLSRLVQGGAIDAATAVDWAKKDRYAPEVVAALEKYWAGGTSSKGDPHVTKAENQLWTRLHTSYLAGEIDAQAAAAALPTAGVAAAAIADVLSTWDEERTLIRKQLTPTQLRKAWQGNIVNPATGAAWTQDEAIAALVSRGYSLPDAQTFMAE